MSSYYFSGHDQGPPKTPVHSGSSVACGGAPSQWLQSDASNESSAQYYTSHNPSTSPDANVSQSLDTPWVCEHRWSSIANMIAWRKSAGANGVSNFQKNGGDGIGFCRGSAACVAINRGSSAWQANLKFSVPAGEYCDVIQSYDTATCPTVTVAADGSVQLQVPSVGAVAVHIGKKKANSGKPIIAI